MKKIKTILLGAFVLTCTSFVMAQTSNTSKSTAGIFGNDTDDFMSVSDWSGVSPENFFGTLGYSNNLLNLGAAKKFGNLYFGAYLDGNIGLDFYNNTTSTSSSSSSSTTSSSSDSKTKTSNGKTSDFDLSALVGIGDNLGVKAFFDFTGNATTASTSSNGTSSTTSSSTTTTTTTDTSNVTKVQEINTGFEVGYNLSVGDYFLKNFGGFTVDVNQNKTKTYDANANPTTTEVDTGSAEYKIGGGSTVVFPKKYDISQSATGSLYFNFASKEPLITNIDTDENNYSHDTTKYSIFGISFEPAYKLTYDKIDRLNLGAKISCPIKATFGTTNNPNSTKTSEAKTYADDNNYVTTTSTTKSSSNGLYFTPALSVGLQYVAVPEKLTINAGASVSSPTLTAVFSNTTTETSTTRVEFGTASTSNSSSRTKSTTWWGADSTGILTLSTGFTYLLAKTVTFDCSYNILGDLLSSTLNSQWTSGSSSVWNNVNLVLFHNLNLQVSVKL